MSFRDQLKIRTLEEHKGLEAISRVMQPDFTLDEYRNILRHWAEYYFTFEAMIDENEEMYPEIFEFMSTRRKTALLQSDLNVLEIQPSEDKLSEVRRFLEPIFKSSAGLWGALYVVEGSTLGAQIMTRHLSSHFKLTPENGLHFYQGYGDKTGLYWRDFVEKLQELHLSDDEIESGVESARSVFRFFGRFLES